MNFKKMITLIEMLALTGVISVGFSTWVIVETSFPEMQVKVETENVFNTNHYLSIKNITFSDYDEYGFYKDFIYSDDHSTNGENAGRSLTSYLEFDVEVYLSECSIFEGKLNFNISIDTFQDFSTSNIFLNKCKSAYRDVSSYTITDTNNKTLNINDSKLEKKPLNGKLDDNLTIETTNVSDELILHMKYEFTFSSINDFIDCTKDPFDTTGQTIVGIPFHISISLSGGN